MSAHVFVPDPAWSIARGAPLADEPGLGALTLPGFLREVCERYAQNECLAEPLASGAVVRWTYADLWTRARDVARALIAGGLAKGERVGVLMTNRAEFLSAMFGVSLAGGVAAPMSTFSTPSELKHLLASSGCSTLLYEQHVLRKDFTAALREIAPSIADSSPGALRIDALPYLMRVAVLDGDAAGAVESWADFLQTGTNIDDALIGARIAATSPADAGVIFFSSGSTSKPKGILSAHRGVTIQMWRMRTQQALSGGVRSWTANGFFWSGNFSMVVGATMAAGGSLILQRTFAPEAALELMQVERVQFPFAWPHQWAQLEAAQNWANVNLSALEFVGQDCPLARHPTVKTKWLEPKHAYGSTETFTLSTGYAANTPADEARDSHGKPLPGNSVKIIDPLTGALMPLGQRGEVAIKGPTLMLGYLGTPLDETLDEDGYFRTGDGGYLDADGRLFWEGRLNDIIKTGGANVSPAEVDSVVREHPGVKISQTVGVPHETLGEIVVSCVVARDGAVLDEEHVRAFTREQLASYKTPRRVLFFSEQDLQLTGTAKIKTSALRALAASRLNRES